MQDRVNVHGVDPVWQTVPIFCNSNEWTYEPVDVVWKNKMGSKVITSINV